MRKVITTVLMTLALVGASAGAAYAGDDNKPHCNSNQPGCHHQ